MNSEEIRGETPEIQEEVEGNIGHITNTETQINVYEEVDTLAGIATPRNDEGYIEMRVPQSGEHLHLYCHLQVWSLQPLNAAAILSCMIPMVNNQRLTLFRHIAILIFELSNDECRNDGVFSNGLLRSKH